VSFVTSNIHKAKVNMLDDPDYRELVSLLEEACDNMRQPVAQRAQNMFAFMALFALCKAGI